jgi:hypothetical protein
MEAATATIAFLGPPLCSTNLWNLCLPRGNSLAPLRGDGRELSDGGTERGEERRDRFPPGWGHMVAMRAGDLADQPVRAKQAQFAADPGRAAAPLRAGRGRVREEETLEIPVPEPVEGELATTHGSEQGPVSGVERTECPDPAAAPLGGLAETPEEFVQRRLVIDAGQGIQVAFGGFPRHLCPPVEIGDSAAHGPPRQLPVGVPFLGRYTRRSATC